MTTSPLDDANEADVAEQQRAVADEDATPPTRPLPTLDEADEADAIDQSADVGIDDEYEGSYHGPHRGLPLLGVRSHPQGYGVPLPASPATTCRVHVLLFRKTCESPGITNQ